MENKECIICGKAFTPLYTLQQCCCNSCASILRNRNRNTVKIVKCCEVCGKEMFLTTSNSKRKYCSRECADIGRTTQITKICEICGKEFSVIKCRKDSAKYCSTECQRKSLYAQDNCICPVCGKSFHIKPYHLKKYCNSLGSFCSRECLNAYKKQAYLGSGNHQYGLKGPLNASFKGNIILEKNHNLIEQMVYCPTHPFCNKNGRVKLHRLIVEENYQIFDRKYFIEINGNFYLPPKINVHHKDGDHNNNVIENLIPCTKSEHRQYHSPKKKIPAVLKQGELLENLEVGDQQPSLGSV